MRTSIIILFLLVTINATAALSTPSGAQTRSRHPAVSPDDRNLVEAAMENYARLLRAGTPAEVANSFDDEGELQLPGLSALHGRNEILEFLTPLTSAMEVDAVDMKTVLLNVHGTTADQWGTYKQIAGKKGEAKQSFYGRYAAIWQKGQDGHWRILRLMMQPLPADGK